MNRMSRVYEVDLEKANELLDKAGLCAQTDGTRFSLTLDYIPIVPSQQHDVALYLKYQLEKIGIEVEVRTSAGFSEWAERIGNWDFDMTMDAVYNWGDPVIGVHRTLYLRQYPAGCCLDQYPELLQSQRG